MLSWLRSLSDKKRPAEREAEGIESTERRPAKRSRGAALDAPPTSAFTAFEEAAGRQHAEAPPFEVSTQLYNETTAAVVDWHLEQAKRTADELRSKGAQAAMRITSSALAEADQLRREAERDAAERRKRVEAECARIRQRAQAEASEIRREAEADAERMRREAELEVRRKAQQQRLEAAVAAPPTFSAASVSSLAPPPSTSAPAGVVSTPVASVPVPLFGAPAASATTAVASLPTAPTPPTGGAFVFGGGAPTSTLVPAPVAPTFSATPSGGINLPAAPGIIPPAGPLFGSGIPPQPAIPGGASGFALGTPPLQERTGGERRVRRARRPPKT